ncbi:Annexin [Hexamita inflata]|uniref:Annexin n=2 Tax=Hexamita inflata TaxID=28002 RepID=A0AA86TJX0_9EUKA|nr:Annexin [Hexamita inflata]
MSDLNQSALSTNTTATTKPRHSSYGQSLVNLPSLPPREHVNKIRNSQSPVLEEVVMKDRLPKKIQQLMDCNELRRELLSLMQQEKQMEYKLRKMEERIKHSGNQLVEEEDRPNEDILTKKRNQKFRLEKQIDLIKQKTLSIQMINLDAERQKIEKDALKQKDLLTFCSNLSQIQSLIEFKLMDVNRFHLQGAMDAAKKQKQSMHQTVINQIQIDQAKIRTELTAALNLRNIKFVQTAKDVIHTNEFRADLMKKFEEVKTDVLAENPEMQKTLDEFILSKPIVVTESQIKLKKGTPENGNKIGLQIMEKFVKVEGDKLSLKQKPETFFDVVTNEDKTKSFKYLGLYVTRVEELDKGKITLQQVDSEQAHWIIDQSDVQFEFKIKSAQSDKFLTFFNNQIMLMLDMGNNIQQIFKFAISTADQPPVNPKKSKLPQFDEPKTEKTQEIVSEKTKQPIQEEQKAKSPEREPKSKKSAKVKRSPSSFDLDKQVEQLHSQKTEDEILRIALKHNYSQRAGIAAAYKQKFNISLESELKLSVDVDLINLCTGLFMTRADFWALQINEALTNKKDTHLIYLIFMQQGDERIEVQTRFKELFGNDMDIAVINALGQHDWQKLVKAWLKQNKDESSPEQHAEALHNAVLKSGVDEDAFINILSAKPAKFREVTQLFEEKHKKPLREVIKAEFGGDAEFAFTLAHDVLMSRADAAAFLVYTATKGSGTKDQMLVNTTILFSEFAKDQVQGAYAKFGDMTKDLKGDLAGKYEDAVLTLWGLK